MLKDAHKDFLREIFGKKRVSDKTLQKSANSRLISRHELFKCVRIVRLHR